MTGLAGLLGDVRAATAFRYDAHDSVGNRMDTAKVILSPAGGYLAVYHDHEICHLATSTDLMTWTHRVVIDEPATQPTIASTGDGGLLTAVEFNDGHGGQLRVRYWPTLDALLAVRPAREFLAPRTLSACNEGTPSVRRIGLDSDLDSSWVELGFHYHRDCRVDRQALGTLTGFRAWTSSRYPELDAAVERDAAAVDEQVRGNIGDRDHLRYLGRDYDLVEAQGRRGDFGTWRIYLYDRSAGTAERLEVLTHAGSTAFANPTATLLRDPAGRDALMVSLFLPMEGAAQGEAGSLLYVVPIGQADPAASPSPVVSHPDAVPKGAGHQHVLPWLRGSRSQAFSSAVQRWLGASTPVDRRLRWSSGVVEVRGLEPLASSVSNQRPTAMPTSVPAGGSGPSGAK